MIGPRSDDGLLCTVELNPYCSCACLHCKFILHTHTDWEVCLSEEQE